MYKVIDPSKPIKEEYKNYWLCFIGSIRMLDWNMDENEQIVSSINKDYKPLRREYFAYFTKNLNQWGDDWNDPFNMGDIPYDNECDILKIPFSINHDLGIETLELRLPDYYGSGEQFSVQEINLGAIPWMFLTDQKIGYSFMAGIKIEEFIKTLSLAKDYVIKKLEKANFFTHFKSIGLYGIPETSQEVFVKYNSISDRVYFYEKDKITPKILPVKFDNNPGDEYSYSHSASEEEWEQFKSKNNIYVKEKSEI